VNQKATRLKANRLSQKPGNAPAFRQPAFNIGFPLRLGKSFGVTDKSTAANGYLVALHASADSGRENSADHGKSRASLQVTKSD
tara:strand:+ start:113 stop:364 length:252 start_codon:yes stop_codon:yes gene_type:complete